MSGEKAIHRQELERGLLTQKISRLFLKYTIPGVAGLLFLGIQSVIDGVILGRFVGANALASVNLILPCYSLMTALSIVIGVGCQTLIGINLGRSDRQEANNAITTSFLFLGGISVLISGLIYIFAGDIARILGGAQRVAAAVVGEGVLADVILLFIIDGRPRFIGQLQISGALHGRADDLVHFVQAGAVGDGGGNLGVARSVLGGFGYGRSAGAFGRSSRGVGGFGATGG